MIVIRSSILSRAAAHSSLGLRASEPPRAHRSAAGAAWLVRELRSSKPLQWSNPENQRPVITGSCQWTRGYFGVLGPAILGDLAFQTAETNGFKVLPEKTFAVALHGNRARGHVCW